MLRIDTAQVTRCCAAPLVWLGRGQEPRCAGCGHRQAHAGRAPRATRTLPPWLWLRELHRRALAVRARTTWLDDPWKGPSW